MNFIHEYHTSLFAYLVESRRDQLLQLRMEPTNSIVKAITSIYVGYPIIGKNDALLFLHNLQNRIEGELKQRISTKGTYYWFHLYRRIAPRTSFDNESHSTLWIYRNMLECAFIKYGKSICGEEILFLNKPSSIDKIASGSYKEAIKGMTLKKTSDQKAKGIFLGKFSFDDLVEIYRLERLIYEFWHISVCVRRLHKGGKLVIENGEYFVVCSEETESLMQYYDKRERLDLVTSSGLVIESSNIDYRGVSFLPKYNVGKLSLDDYPYQIIFSKDMNVTDISTKKGLIPNFIWLPFDFDYYYRIHCYLKNEFLDTFGFSLECFITTLYLLVEYTLLYCRQNITKGSFSDLMKRAYRHSKSKKRLAFSIVEFSKLCSLPSLSEYHLNGVEVSRLFSYFEDMSINEKVNLTTLGPRKLFIKSSEGGFIIDFASIYFILITQMHFIDKEQDTKGHIFEDIVIEKLESAQIRLWVCKKKLRHSDGTSKEIDISFIYKNVLFLCELKCNKMSMDFTIGDIKALEFRKKKNKAALDQVDKKADWLSLRRSGRNYALPDDVNVIVPIVVTPFNEYIWSRNVGLWISADIARICMPNELVMLQSDEIINDVVTKPYTRFLL